MHVHNTNYVKDARTVIQKKSTVQQNKVRVVTTSLYGSTRNNMITALDSFPLFKIALGQFLSITYTKKFNREWHIITSSQVTQLTRT